VSEARSLARLAIYPALRVGAGEVH
jgi:hypothetical protein